jgi:hypothetical protein
VVLNTHEVEELRAALTRSLEELAQSVDSAEQIADINMMLAGAVA